MKTFEDVINNASTVFGDAGELFDDGVYAVDFGGVKLVLFTVADHPDEVRFRTRVAPLDGIADPAAFCEAALQGNFFWSGTGGATLSLNREDRALYITDCLSAESLPDADAVLAACRDLLRVVQDWCRRWMTHLPPPAGKEVP